MRRVVCCCASALLAVATLSAQDKTIKTETQIKSDDAKVVTMTGCVSGGPQAFILTNAVFADDKKGDKKSDKAVGTSGSSGVYALTPNEGVDLKSQLGHKVEVIGAIIPAAKDGDKDAKLEVREKTRVDREDAPDSRSETRTESQIARGPHAQFAVASVKMVSPICLQ
jgi:hypothetical protein